MQAVLSTRYFQGHHVNIDTVKAPQLVAPLDMQIQYRHFASKASPELNGYALPIVENTLEALELIRDSTKRREHFHLALNGHHKATAIQLVRIELVPILRTQALSLAVDLTSVAD